ncbi:hypothetical protein ACIP5N_32070 [Streptomyces sp. NPDC088768]|uniref:hypothetical protein n=1 Tax=Streptomyces sp. NPDC088768 TaxID=3365894 RepID=UPI00381A738E
MAVRVMLRPRGYLAAACGTVGAVALGAGLFSGSVSADRTTALATSVAAAAAVIGRGGNGPDSH